MNEHVSQDHDPERAPFGFLVFMALVSVLVLVGRWIRNEPFLPRSYEKYWIPAPGSPHDGPLLQWVCLGILVVLTLVYVVTVLGLLVRAKNRNLRVIYMVVAVDLLLLIIRAFGLMSGIAIVTYHTLRVCIYTALAVYAFFKMEQLNSRWTK